MPAFAANRAISHVARRFFFLSLLLTLLVIPVFVVARVPTMNPAVHSKELATRVLLVIVFIGYAAAWPALARRRLALPQAALLGFIGVNVLSALTSGRAGYSFSQSWHLWGLMALSVLVWSYAPRCGEYRKVVYVVIAAAFLAAMYGICVYFGLDPLRPWYPFAPGKEEGRNYVYSFLGNPEYFGGYMAVAAALAFGQIFDSEASLRRRVAWLGLCFVFLFALVLSGTRGAAIGFLAGGAVVFFSSLRRFSRPLRRRLIGLVGFAAAAVVFVGTVFSFPNPLNYRDLRLARRFVDLFDLTSASLRERVLFYSVSARMIAEHPVLGIGPGIYRLEFYPYVEELSRADERAGMEMTAANLRNRVAEHAHNDYLEFWSETGTVGFALLLLFLSAAAVEALRLPRPCKPEAAAIPEVAAGRMERDLISRRSWNSLFLARTSFLGASVCLFLNALFSFPLHLPVRASLGWVAVGCFFSASESLRDLDRTAGSNGASSQ